MNADLAPQLASAIDIWRAGFVRRWHMNPDLSWLDDTTAAHQGRCAALVIALFPDHSHALLRAAVTHDLAEVRVGDLSRPFKRCGGDLVAAHARLEADQRAAMGVDVTLSPDDQQRLDLVDRLDAALLVRLRAPHHAGCDEWQAENTALVDLAGTMGLGQVVGAMLWGAP